MVVAVEGSFVGAHLREDGVEAFVAFLGLLAVPLDPSRHQVEDLGLEVARPPLGVLALAEQAGVGEHLDVLGDRLDGDVVRTGQLPDRGVADGETGHDVSPRRIGERSEHSRQSVVVQGTSSLLNQMVEDNVRQGTSVVNRLVEDRACEDVADKMAP